eukprot:14467428-Heterocapsa_arctica.AAC.1
MFKTSPFFLVHGRQSELVVGTAINVKSHVLFPVNVRVVKEDLSDFVAIQLSTSAKTGIEAIAISRNILYSIAFSLHHTSLSSGSRVGSLTNSIIGSTVVSPSPAIICNGFAPFVHPQVHLACYVRLQKESIVVAFKVTLSIH